MDATNITENQELGLFSRKQRLGSLRTKTIEIRSFDCANIHFVFSGKVEPWSYIEKRNVAHYKPGRVRIATYQTFKTI
ncbi:hypothetical protein IGI04_031024 [Brassica rapa subsp. trilocularis]|uniref:Uncharacterized protein n=1 Tax=Brassica rapa subsp. trilocularis TaxID=1813537 RepID=A0ABQ7LSE9_BRACM|nr:hypothetical protein IGI04_031024 [Brassica rapa subsp. trilocularis]